MGRTDGLTDWRTDGQGGDYMLPRNFSGSIKMCNDNLLFAFNVDMFDVDTQWDVVIQIPKSNNGLTVKWRIIEWKLMRPLLMPHYLLFTATVKPAHIKCLYLYLNKTH